MKCIAVCGDSASGKTVLSNLLSYQLSDSFVLECDRYHRWERQDDNWTRYTHLNPIANNIDLLNVDIQDLTSGKSIFRRDYDHSVGKFTEEHEIKSPKNLIVCGLHSLMCHEYIYDLKIFMDTDAALKREWKIARDMTKRGYQIQEVEEQINRRKNDFELFIKPLAERANLIVNFRNKTDLRLLIDSHYVIDNILSKFNELSVNYTILSHNNRFQIDIVNRANYDYIILCALDMLNQK